MTLFESKGSRIKIILAFIFLSFLVANILQYTKKITLDRSNIGLSSVYFNDIDLKDETMMRVDSQIDFDWSTDSPDSKIKNDGFSARWLGYVKPEYSETYTFYTHSDDGVRLWIDGKLIIDDWNTHYLKENNAELSLQKDKEYTLKVEYFDARIEAQMSLYWSSPSQQKEVIPSSNLFIDKPYRFDFNFVAAFVMFTSLISIFIICGYKSNSRASSKVPIEAYISALYLKLKKFINILIVPGFQRKTIKSPMFILPVLLVMSVVKSYVVANYSDEFLISGLLKMIISDFLFIGIIGIFIVIIGLAKKTYVSLIAFFLFLLFLFVFLIDLSLILTFGMRFNWDEVIKYLPETKAIWSFIGLKEFFSITIFILAASIFVGFKGTRYQSVLKFSSILIFIYFVVPIDRSPDLARYQKNVISLAFPTSQNRSPIEKEAYNNLDYKYFDAERFNKRNFPFDSDSPNIILLMVENFSAGFSHKVSGLPGKVSAFDQLSEQGTLFVNFFANGVSTDAGTVGLLSGVAPLQYPGGENHIFTSYAKQGSFISYLNSLDYFTEFLTTADLDFAKKRMYMTGVGFDRYSGLDEIEAFKNAPKVSFGSPSDDYLYNEALKRIKAYEGNSERFFLSLMTVSTHAPARHPYVEGGNVWEWTASEIARFSRSLEEIDFFNNGILIITGDHHAMGRTPKSEIEVYGDSAKARTPLLLLGKGVPQGYVDSRLLQQSDLFYKFDKLFKPEEQLSPFAILRENSSWRTDVEYDAGEITVFMADTDKKNGYPLNTSGASLHWPGSKPDQHKDVEYHIHQQRAAAQHYLSVFEELEEEHLSSR